MTSKPYSPDKYLFVMTLTVRIKKCEKVNVFKPNTPQRQKHRFVSHSPPGQVNNFGHITLPSYLWLKT